VQWGLRSWFKGQSPFFQEGFVTDANNETLLGLTADIVASHVANNTVATSDLPALISNVYSALSNVNGGTPAKAIEQEPAVSIRASIKPDYIVCLEDGKKLKMLKRHLMTRYQMTPADYRAKWKLPADYPMVAPNYAAQRRKLAHEIGLGRKTKTPPVKAAPAKAAPAAAAAKPARVKAATLKIATPKATAPAKAPKPAKAAAAKPATPRAKKEKPAAPQA
jgi:predicted transcriptional regulator